MMTIFKDLTFVEYCFVEIAILALVTHMRGTFLGGEKKIFCSSPRKLTASPPKRKLPSQEGSQKIS
jgi:hypothetical protein